MYSIYSIMQPVTHKSAKHTKRELMKIFSLLFLSFQILYLIYYQFTYCS